MIAEWGVQLHATQTIREGLRCVIQVAKNTAPITSVVMMTLSIARSGAPEALRTLVYIAAPTATLDRSIAVVVAGQATGAAGLGAAVTAVRAGQTRAAFANRPGRIRTVSTVPGKPSMTEA